MISFEFLQKLVDLFYPLVETTLFDPSKKMTDIFNPLSNLKEDQILEIKDENTPYVEILSNGKKVRTLLFLTGEGYIRIRYDLSTFSNLHSQLDVLLQGTTNTSIQKSDPWQSSIDQVIQQFLLDNRISIQALNQKQKRDLISQIHGKGLFDFKDSTSYAATQLQTSRATIYNYLKTLASLNKIHVHQVDAFTDKRFGGNPAGVVLDADDLDEVTMRKIARELNLSETAFISSCNDATFKMRYFTPTGHEISFCGHSTVGALYMIAKEKRYGTQTVGKHLFKVQTSCGILDMEATVNSKDEITVAYETPKINLKHVDITHEMVANAAGFDVSKINTTLPVMYEVTNQDLFLVVRSLHDLKHIECDPKQFATFSKQHSIVSLCLFCLEAFEAQNQIHMRCFAPLVGVPEDPFTGSVLGGLVAYVDQFKLLKDARQSFSVEQGHFIDRPGVVKVEYRKKNGEYFAKAFARAVHCFSTEVNLI